MANRHALDEEIARLDQMPMKARRLPNDRETAVNDEVPVGGAKLSTLLYDVAASRVAPIEIASGISTLKAVSVSIAVSLASDTSRPPYLAFHL